MPAVSVAANAPPSPRRWWYAGAVAMAVAVGIAVLWWFDPNAQGNPFVPCIFNLLTGFYCPGCGITRALHALAHLDVFAAIAMNPMAVLVLLPLAGLALSWAIGFRARWMVPVLEFFSRPWVWMALLPGYWIARNLPWPPFAWLAPGALLAGAA